MNKWNHGLRILLIATVLVAVLPRSRAAVVISEFLAANSGGLKDADGDSSDWIEIHNDSVSSAVDLAGWRLTDSPGNPVKWIFPATNLPPDGFLIVFASDKNRATAGAELHTNFKLGTDGDYLALVKADGTISSAYSPAFPKQRENVSYGLARDVFSTPLISTDAAARLFVPTNGALGPTWTARVFNDSSWLATNTPISFSAGVASNALLSIDFNERAVDVSTTTPPEFASFVIISNSGSAAIQTTPTTRFFGGLSLTVSNNSTAGYDDRLRATPNNSGAFTDSLLLRDFIFSTDQASTNGIDVVIAGLSPGQMHRLTIWSFDSGSPGNRISDWSASGTVVTNGYIFNGSSPPTSNEQYRFTFDRAADGAGKILISARRNPTTAGPAVFLNALKVETLAATPVTNGLASLMFSNNATAYIRVPFSVTDTNAISALNFRVKYDDGFVAYINGQLVAARNAPASPQWNSTATATHEPLDFEDILIPNTPGLLVNGSNVLAIQGLNISADDNDFFALPELTGVAHGDYALRYFAPPTPGEENGPGYLGLVEETEFSAQRGFYDAPFSVAISTPTIGAAIFWTTNGSAPSPSNGFSYTSPVAVNGTTLLRARAFFPNYVDSVPITHSYIFLEQVLQQPANPPGYPTTWQGGFPGDYGMDPNVVNSANYGPTLTNDLRSIPTISLVTDFNLLWHSSTGICVDATQRGDFWERPASVEMFEGDNTSVFQVNCGVQMQGNAGRDNARTPKHSFRFVFKSSYGPGKLRFPIFPDTPLSSFDTFVLRNSWTDAWTTRYSDSTVIPGTTNIGTRYRPEDSLNLRDVWVKDSQRAMGDWLAGHSDFVHFYVNGLYWGIYNNSEHIDSDFVSLHLGGWEEDWDVLVGSDTTALAEVVDGSLADWAAMMALVNSGITDETSYQAVAQLVDIDNLIDYMLVHIFSEVEDWPSHNWYAAHRRANPTTGLPGTKWIFITWDQDIALDQLVRRNRINVSNNDTPARIYSQLRNWPEFRSQFGDRIQKHFFNGGALTASNNIARMMNRAARIDRAIVAESARWGDAREFTGTPPTGQTFTRDEWWLPELEKLYTNFFATLTETNLARFRAGNLYPALSAPGFNQFGGNVPAGFSLTMTHTNASGVIYFTLDGTDPRQYGTAAIAPTAQAYETPVALNAATVVRARVFNAGNWSALVEAIFFPPQDLSKLALTELMYNPPALGAITGNDLEFLELKNYGTNTLNLSGLTFSGITFAFTNGTLLAPGQFFVLARNASAFATKYPGVTVNGVYGGQLDNSGEQITLSHSLGGNIFSITYDDQSPWPVSPDGFGFSLVPKNPGLTQAPDDGAKWRASSQMGGSPGVDDPEPNIPPILINEVLSHTDPPELDTIELYNPTGATVDISGWFLTDNAGSPNKFRIPDGTVLPAGGYAFFDENDFNASIGTNINFAFSSTGEEAYVFSANTNGTLTGYSHGLVFGPMFNGVNFGRYVNSVGEEFFPRQDSVTLGLPNSGPRIGPVVFNEIHYHPDAGGDEFLELLNVMGNPVPLFAPAFPTNTWKVGGVAYTFPTNITLGPSQLLLLVATDPASFRAKYSVPEEIQILGPFSGALQNNGERLTLEAPDTPNAGVVPYVVVEEVRYDDQSPWPPAADGSGPSLQRISRNIFGNEPANWTAASPTPGQLLDTADTDGDGMSDAWEIAHGLNWQVNDADEDPDGDGVSNLQEFLNGTDPQVAENFFRLGIQLNANFTASILDFYTLPGKNYSIEQTPGLSPTNWTSSFTLPGVTNARPVRVTNSISSSEIFYRLRIE